MYRVCGLTYLTTSHELHDKEEVLLILIDVVQLDDVWMIDLFQDIDFILESDFVFLRQFAPRIKTSLNHQNQTIKKASAE